MASLPPRPRHLEFPGDWVQLAAHGAHGFITRLVHRLPDGRLHLWHSRRHRKQRPPMVVEAPDGDGDIASHERIEALEKRHPWRWVWWCWQPARLAWWVGLIFFLGSWCFIFGTVPPTFPSVQEWLGSNDIEADWWCFAGSVFFTVGSWLQWLEVLNAPPPQRADGAVAGRGAWRWWGWDPDRLDFRLSAVQLAGALLFNVNCWFSLYEGLPWQTANLIVWTPSTIASCCFIVAAHLGLVEVAHKPWGIKPYDIGWWTNLFGLLGAVGFFTSSVFGFFAQGPLQLPQWWGNDLALMMGSVFFLASTYLLIPETALEK
ncbi:MAG: hypothetical protein AAGK14_05055 [Verrucomicrobiota bacterium]